MRTPMCAYVMLWATDTVYHKGTDACMEAANLAMHAVYSTLTTQESAMSLVGRLMLSGCTCQHNTLTEWPTLATSFNG